MRRSRYLTTNFCTDLVRPGALFVAFLFSHIYVFFPTAIFDYIFDFRFGTALHSLLELCAGGTAASVRQLAELGFYTRTVWLF